MFPMDRLRAMVMKRVQMWKTANRIALQNKGPITHGLTPFVCVYVCHMTVAFLRRVIITVFNL